VTFTARLDSFAPQWRTSAELLSLVARKTTVFTLPLMSPAGSLGA
jgi:hypothetical protein